MKQQIPALVAAGGGSVVDNSSLAGVGGIPEPAPYAAAKHGVVGLTGRPRSSAPAPACASA
ncbi:MAG TPA: SDR family NAD(P)-dependent oxidoreductase [Acidimicrobiales bacterium]|nr:SDR family NAD(P)-dependent oxidoreductase [Acidimicrobiales bacterium]